MLRAAKGKETETAGGCDEVLQRGQDSPPLARLSTILCAHHPRSSVTVLYRSPHFKIAVDSSMGGIDSLCEE
jgi:hypothetical protein